ncbi:hypothetical protein ABMA28_015536 [Loxostege sticticalis]|uniref:Osteopetrosis-associated transmembrane protein 1 n=1 Tax=Loxostege sticticalis TaxID=481309 RepID=A0ABD0TAD6_LOXSC
MEKHYCVFVLYLFYSTISAKDESFIMKANTKENILNQEEGYSFPYPVYPEECTSLLNTIAQYASNFTFCSIKNAKPITLCRNCVENYSNLSKIYNELMTKVVNETTCGSLLISQDRFDVVLEYYDRITDIWNKGHCNDCFDFTNETANLSNNTIRFNKMAEDTMNCITSTYNLTNNTEEVCVRCMQSYISLDIFYKSLSKDSIGVDTICMDIVDSMNTTRSVWSKSLNCCKLRKTPEIIFLCCTGIISLLPLLFYVAVKYCGPIRDLPNVLKESRFKQSILRSVQGRIN